MARFSLSRSAISMAMMCSVGIQFLRLSAGAGDCKGSQFWVVGYFEISGFGKSPRPQVAPHFGHLTKMG